MRHFPRLFTMLYLIFAYRLDRMVLSRLRCPSFWLAWIIPNRAKYCKDDGERIQQALLALGPIAIKFGQSLSCRNDYFSPVIIQGLSSLQDQVPPFEFSEVQRMVESALGPLTSNFSTFDPVPHASASIAQVHFATRRDGRSVAVKILRPNIHTLVAKDCQVILFCAGLLEKFHPKASKLRALESAREYQRTTLNELDCLKEAANTDAMRDLYLDDPRLVVPKIHWDLCRPSIMVSQRLDGLPISQIYTCNNTNPDLDLKRLARHGVELFFDQLLEHNFFHADMHPGNVLVCVKNPKFPIYMAVDFGIVSSLTPQDQLYIASNLSAFFKRDYRRVAQLHVDSGWVPKHTHVLDMAASLRAVGESIHAKPIREISFAALFASLLAVAKDYDMIVQPQLLLLQKTLFNIEALGRNLDGDLNLWTIAHPIVENWLARQTAFRSCVNKAMNPEGLIDWIQTLVNTTSMPPPSDETTTKKQATTAYTIVFTFSLMVNAWLIIYWLL